MRLRGVGLLVGVLVGLGLLLPAAALTLARLLQPDGSQRGVLAVALAPLALPVYLLALLALAAPCLRPGRLRAVACVAAAVAIGGAVVHGAWLAPQFGGGRPAAAEGAQPLVVMTANVENSGGDLSVVLDTVREEHVDVLVLVEIEPDGAAELARAGIDELLPHHAGAPDISGSGTMVFSRLPLSDAEQLPTTFGCWRVTVDGDVSLLAVHPVSPVSPGEWGADHDVIAQSVRSDPPDLMAGDFNATRDHVQLRRLLDTGLRDATDLADAGWQPTWPADTPLVHGVRLPPLFQIDHVLVGATMTALSSRTVDVPGTDHRALVAVVAPRAE